MDNLIKNLNYSAEETNDILASVATKASNIALQEVKQNVVNISEYIEEYEADTNTKFEELKVTIDSFQENLTTLSTNLTTLSDSFTEKSNSIEGKFAEINSKISSTEESINSNIEGINDNIVGLKTQLQTTDLKIDNLLNLTIDQIFLKLLKLLIIHQQTQKVIYLLQKIETTL